MKLVFLLVATLTFADKFDQFLGVQPIRHVLSAVCAEMGVPVYIAAGLQVSEWHPGEPDPGTCKGWWQLDTQYHAWYRDTFHDGVEFDEYDPIASTVVAVRYLAWLYRQNALKTGRLQWWKALVDYKHGWATPASPAIVELCKGIAEGRILF